MELPQDETSGEDDAVSTPALAREHSYLEESHPLLPDNYEQLSNNNNNNNNNNIASSGRHSRRFELAILELHGVVLFPDCTIPIKLQNRSMIQYIGRQIQKCRTDPVAQPKVLIGILPYYDTAGRTANSSSTASSSNVANSNSRRRSWMRQRFSFGNGEIAPTASSRRLRQSLMAIRDEFMDSDSNDDNDSSDSDSSDDFPMHFSSNAPQQPTTNARHHHHPLVGRIGTIATVRHTHERTAQRRRPNDNESSAVWGNYQEAPELVFTAVGTSRFKIVAEGFQPNIFQVEELVEATVQKPPFSKLLPGGGLQESSSSSSSSQMLAWNLSQLTPLPYSLYQHKLPWCLVEKIAQALKANEWRGNLPSLGDESIVTNRSKLEPRAFSYWMANNAPFSESEKLKLLEMDSVLERLLYIWKTVQKLTTTQSEVCCGLCGAPLAEISQIFVVGGAEGTTSAYVNPHGCIHQITTLREVLDPSKVSFRDLPSTENSYFPGYSWWITCCSLCGSMLGWKFQKVLAANSRSIMAEQNNNGHDSSDEENELGDASTKHTTIDKDTPQRPPYFYGFMASNVKVSSRRTTGRGSSQ